MKHFNDLPANSVAIGTAEALLEAFFNVQIDAHVKAWRWKCYTEGKYYYCSKGIVYGTAKTDWTAGVRGCCFARTEELKCRSSL